MKITYRIALSAALMLVTPAIFAQQSESDQAAEPPAAGLVVASEGTVERCILPVVVTSIDGEEVAADTTQFELEAGRHTFRGYGTGDASPCATFSGEGGLPLPAEDARVGESELAINVEAGKEYYLGVDVRSKDKSDWKLVVWKLVH